METICEFQQHVTLETPVSQSEGGIVSKTAHTTHKPLHPTLCKAKVHSEKGTATVEQAASVLQQLSKNI